ncbi:MAG: hypothetical protein M2R45_02053 [Verrucomicrobia subdivision 3 bacterium]|nr:hypothetical protein [Limisphaerales bacterium]MCS1414873.1 hypothetical protein [Limisphaerales bacterium]
MITRAAIDWRPLFSVAVYLNTVLTDREVLVVGDILHDIRCARSIGADCLAIATGGVAYRCLFAERPASLSRIF